MRLRLLLFATWGATACACRPGGDKDTTRGGSDGADGDDGGATDSGSPDGELLEGDFVVLSNPDLERPGLCELPWYVDVWGLSIYGEDGVSEAKLLHAANVLAQLLDNDEDGVIDDATVFDELLRMDALMPVFTREGSPGEEDFFENYDGRGAAAVLYAGEVDPDNPGRWGWDATIEETMHTINAVGHVSVYPEVFDLEPDSSALSAAMDVARGGQYTSVPASYPDAAWYHYTDRTCDYGCMAIEYIYWAQVARMGLLADTATCDGIADEWELCTPDQLESTDTRVHAILTDPANGLPQTAPDGSYSR